jgi:hypothetical protein
LGSNRLVFVASLDKHAALRRKSKNWLNVFEWGDMSIRGYKYPNKRNRT